MAFTYERQEPLLNIGGAWLYIFKVDFDGVTGGKITTGLNNVLSAKYIPNTSDKHGIVYKNSASASNVEDDAGDVYVDSVTSDDEGIVEVIGI